MGDFERALPSEITKQAIPSGDELVIPLDETKRAIHIATQNLIAVRGVEIFRILDSGLRLETNTGYDLRLGGEWQDYVWLNNGAALRFMDENAFGEGYGCILTAPSESEFRELRGRHVPKAAPILEL